MSEYSALLGTVARIADAAIEWDMRDLGWWRDEHGWVSDASVNVATTYQLDFTGMYVRDLHYGDTYRVGEGAWAEADFRGLWRSWYERANQAFRPWLGLPDPADFEAPVGTLRAAAGALNVTTTVSSAGSVAESTLESGNGDLDADLLSLTGEVIAMNGLTMDAFARGYSNRLPGVVRGQLAITAMLGCCLTAEQQLWQRARADVARLADDVLVVMERRGGGGGSETLSVIGAVLAGASLFFTSGASAALVKNGRAVVGLLGGFLPEEEALTPAQESLSGDTASEVHGRLLDALAALGTAVRGEEALIRESLVESAAEVSGRSPDAFDLGDRPDLLGVPLADVLHPADIAVKPDTLVFLGTDVVPGIAGALRGARATAQGAAGAAPWERHPDIGLGPQGAYAEWQALHDLLLDVLTSTSRTLGDVGERLVDVAAQFVEVDRGVSDVYALPGGLRVR